MVFSLPRWALHPQNRSLGEWLVDDLVAEYGVAAADAQAVVDQKRVFPLLDGLDEVAAERRQGCVDAIRTGCTGSPVVVCGREDYGLDFRAIRVETLSREEMEGELARPELACVREAMEGDPLLREAVNTPL